MIELLVALALVLGPHPEPVPPNGNCDQACQAVMVEHRAVAEARLTLARWGIFVPQPARASRT